MRLGYSLCFMPRWIKYSVPLVLFAIFLIPDRSLAGQSKTDIPNPARVILAKAGKLINDKDYAKAIALLVDFQGQDAAGETGNKDSEGRFHAEVHQALGTCYLLDNKFRQAAPCFERALQKNPQLLSAWLNLAKAFYELNDYQKAAECFREAYELSPEKNPEHLYFSAVALLLAKQNKQSIQVFERLLAAHHDEFSPEWRENLVHALLAANEHHRALVHIRHLAEEYSGEKQMQWQEILLHQYLQLDMEREALALVNLLNNRTPTEPKWWRALVHIHLQKSRYRPALTALLVTGYLEPLSEQEMQLAADLYLQLGVPQKAAPLYETMLNAKKSSRLLNNLVIALQQLEQPEMALAALEKFSEEAMSPKMAMLKADLLYTSGNYKDAARYYHMTAESGEGKQRDRARQMEEYAKLQADNEQDEMSRRRQTATF
ncbi:MAG: tetratricopeptide repeat protein [Desulfopila sp.]